LEFIYAFIVFLNILAHLAGMFFDIRKLKVRIRLADI